MGPTPVGGEAVPVQDDSPTFWWQADPVDHLPQPRQHRTGAHPFTVEFRAASFDSLGAVDPGQIPGLKVRSSGVYIIAPLLPDRCHLHLLSSKLVGRLQPVLQLPGILRSGDSCRGVRRATKSQGHRGPQLPPQHKERGGASGGVLYSSAASHEYQGKLEVPVSLISGNRQSQLSTQGAVKPLNQAIALRAQRGGPGFVNPEPGTHLSEDPGLKVPALVRVEL